MASDQLVDKLRRDFKRVGQKIEENPHDPRVLDVAMHEYRLIAAMAIDEIDRLQTTIYTYYANDRT